jgi:hypothetical protein
MTRADARSPFSARLCMVVATLGIVRVGVAATPPAPPVLDVTSEAVRAKLTTNASRIDVVAEGGGKALRISFSGGAQWPSVKFPASALGYPADWSGAGHLALTVSNPTDVAFPVNVRIDPAAKDAKFRQGGVEVGPKETIRILMPVAQPPPIVGMRGQPPRGAPAGKDDRPVAVGGGAFDASAMASFQVYSPRPDRERTILLHRIEWLPLPAEGRRAFVDRFGQYNGADWPGKLHGEEEFATRLRAEEEDLKAHPPPADRNKYGGWKAGPQLDATGRFRVAKHEGKWWFIDPEGRLFWSSGITCVRVNAATIVADREACFEWLPAAGDPFAAFYSGRGRGRSFDFFAANLLRKYGPDHPQRFFESAVRRLPSWGLNTLGCWSSPEAARLGRVPFTLAVNSPGAPAFVATSHMKAGLEKKKPFFDPFDPGFAKGLDRDMAALAEFKDSPWLLGVFIHNELPWTLGTPWKASDRAPTGIAALCLQKNDASFRAKKALLEKLRAAHGTIDSLNRAWKTTFASWETVAAPFALTDEQRGAARDDLTALDAVMADQYFRACRAAMDRNFRGVPYLGCRFSGMYDRTIVDVARRHCDVVSFNIYDERPDGRSADELAVEMDFPVIIGEFHFGALDRGMFDAGLRATANQRERAEAYAAYVRSAATAPWCVGAHWFQYLDQALTGRADGENYNIGFVTGTDDPYPEMRDAARALHADLYKLRAGAK